MTDRPSRSERPPPAFHSRTHSSIDEEANIYLFCYQLPLIHVCHEVTT